MKTFNKALIALAFALAPAAAVAGPVTVVDVNAPAVNCVFATSCTNVVNDSVGTFTPPTELGNARLQSRTYPGLAPAPAAGLLAYEYRIDLTSVAAPVAAICVTKMMIRTGIIDALPYPPGALKQVFVITSGGLGSVGVAAVLQSGNMTTFTFGGSGVCPGKTSFFFGYASPKTAPVNNLATLYYSNGTTAYVAVRTP